jgi:hypothetical protein
VKTPTVAKFLLAAALAPGCSWSAFDELADETWVGSAGVADGVEPSQFLSLAAPGTTASTSTFVMLGVGTDSLSTYAYAADGTLAATGVDIRGDATQFGPLNADAVVVADPRSNLVAVVAVTGAVNDGDTKVAHFNADDLTIETQNDFNDPTGASGPLDGPIFVSGAAYAITDDPGTPDDTDLVLARGAQLAFVGAATTTTGTLSACYAESPERVVRGVAALQFDADPADELVAVVNDATGTSPQIVIFDGRAIPDAFADNLNALDNCFDDADPDRTPLARLNGPVGQPDFGHRIVVDDLDGDGDDDLVISAPDSNSVRAFFADSTQATGFLEATVQPPVEASSFGAALAVGDLDGDDIAELVVGAPLTDADGVANAGGAYAYAWSGTQWEQQFVVRDAQAEAEQRMGTDVLVAPWGASDAVLVVSGASEIFTYFRTVLYDDVRVR